MAGPFFREASSQDAGVIELPRNEEDLRRIQDELGRLEKEFQANHAEHGSHRPAFKLMFLQALLKEGGLSRARFKEWLEAQSSAVRLTEAVRRDFEEAWKEVADLCKG